MASFAPLHGSKRQTRLTLLVEARMQRAVARIAESDCPLLLTGEHGVGKRSIAAHIHALSGRFRAPFQEICCAEASLESLETAFATVGTVYLSEISDLSLSLQGAVVQAYFRSPQPPPCRLLCGSSHELPDEVKAWRMREDFYCQVSAVTLHIPPLRHRKPEILLIADELLTQYAKQFDRPKPVLCDEIVDHLMEHTWPDNLPELRTAIQTFVAIGDQAISLAAIKAATRSGRSNGHRRPVLLKEATRASSIQIERQLIAEVLVATGGNRKRAAVELGISYKALLYKLKQMETEIQPTLKNGVAS